MASNQMMGHLWKRRELLSVQINKSSRKRWPI